MARGSLAASAAGSSSTMDTSAAAVCGAEQQPGLRELGWELLSVVWREASD